MCGSLKINLCSGQPSVVPISSESGKLWTWHWHKVQEAQKLKGEENLWNPTRKADSTWQDQFNTTEGFVWWSLGKRDFSSIVKTLAFYLIALTEWFSWIWPGKMVRLLQCPRCKETLDAKQGAGSVPLMVMICVLAITEKSVKEQASLISLVFKGFGRVWVREDLAEQHSALPSQIFMALYRGAKHSLSWTTKGQNSSRWYKQTSLCAVALLLIE